MEKYLILLKALYSKVKKMYQGGEYNDSLALLTNTLNLWFDCPYRGKYLTLMGLNYVAISENDKAERAFLEALAIMPNNPRILDELGTLYYNLGKYEDSERIYRIAKREDYYNFDFIIKSAKAAWKLNKIQLMFKRLKTGYRLDIIDEVEEKKLRKFLLELLQNSNSINCYEEIKKFRKWSYLKRMNKMAHNRRQN